MIGCMPWISQESPKLYWKIAKKNRKNVHKKCKNENFEKQKKCDYCGHPFRVSGFFPSTYHQGSTQYNNDLHLQCYDRIMYGNIVTVMKNMLKLNKMKNARSTVSATNVHDISSWSWFSCRCDVFPMFPSSSTVPPSAAPPTAHFSWYLFSGSTLLVDSPLSVWTRLVSGWTRLVSGRPRSKQHSQLLM